MANANAFIRAHHRHHQPVRAFQRYFQLGVAADGKLVGIAIVGPPVARMLDRRTICEVSRCCTDGTPHAASLLYAAAARIARDLGYQRIQTYVLAEESGVSLRAAGWEIDATTTGKPWAHHEVRQLRLDGSTRRQDQPTGDKVRWARALATPQRRPA
jgi:hypothetical protein